MQGAKFAVSVASVDPSPYIFPYYSLYPFLIRISRIDGNHGNHGNIRR